ncbi:MAG: hypothetical protein HONBIEJF_01678 [Fimbriimonadaceae bacterium]|nr:hypothetical protein [Fimbriimonadaceae bacterium]
MPISLVPSELKLLDRLRLQPKRSFAGRVHGDRLTRQKGISTEFDDYRDYADGDDLRHLDWNVLARLDVPVVKTYRDEEDLCLHVLIDDSASMDFGSPTKLELAGRLGLALSYIAVNGGDSAQARALSDASPTPSLRGRASYPRLQSRIPESALETVRPIAESLRRWLATGPRPGIVCLLSDGWDPDLPAVIGTFAGRSYEFWLMQVVAPEEVDPDLEGDLRLIDAESGQPIEVTANLATLEAYQIAAEGHMRALATSCRRIGGRYRRILSDQNLESVLADLVREHEGVAA